MADLGAEPFYRRQSFDRSARRSSACGRGGEIVTRVYEWMWVCHRKQSELQQRLALALTLALAVVGFEDLSETGAQLHAHQGRHTLWIHQRSQPQGATATWMISEWKADRKGE